MSLFLKMKSVKKLSILQSSLMSSKVSCLNVDFFTIFLIPIALIGFFLFLNTFSFKIQNVGLILVNFVHVYDLIVSRCWLRWPTRRQLTCPWSSGNLQSFPTTRPGPLSPSKARRSSWSVSPVVIRRQVRKYWFISLALSKFNLKPRKPSRFIWLFWNGKIIIKTL